MSAAHCASPGSSTTETSAGRPGSATSATGGRVGGVPARVTAVMAAASAVVHVATVDADSMTSLAMAGLALACLPCAWHLWRAPTIAVWAATVVVDLGMLAVHAPMAAGGSDHVHGGTAHAGMPWPGVVLVAGSLLVGLAVLAAAAVRHRSATRRPPLPAVRAADPLA